MGRELPQSPQQLARTGRHSSSHGTSTAGAGAVQRTASAVPCRAVPRCTILLRYTTPHRTVLCYTVLSYTTLHYTGLCYTTLHCAILHCATLHCAAPRRTLPRCRATPCRMVARHPVLLCCAVLTAPPTAVEQSFLGGEPRGRVAGVQAQHSRGVCGPPGG